MYPRASEEAQDVGKPVGVAEQHLRLGIQSAVIEY
jgi:hypothetical protein